MENSLLKISRIGIPLLLIGTLFLSSDFFIDREINPKIYAFVVLSYVFGICLLLLYRRKLMISSWGITVILFILYINVDSMFTASCRLTTLCLWSAFIVFYPRSDIEKHGQNHCLVVRIAIGLWPITVLEFNSKYDYFSCDGKF